MLPGEDHLELAHGFGDGFLWAAATAAHQVEGGNTNNDWWRWEQLPGKIADGSTSGAACEHYSRFAEDFRTLRGMGHNAHRMSLEWSRIEPEPGHFDSAATEHYRAVIGTLQDLGMTPMVTLHHFTNPAWLADAGGWEDEAVVDRFRAYTHHCVEALGDLVSLWVTINEPNVFAYQSYSVGLWPPQKKSVAAAGRVLRNLVRAHAAAYRVIRDSRHGPAAKVGVAQHLRIFEPWHPWSPADRVAAAFPRRAFNNWFLRACSDGFAGFPLGVRERVPEAAGTMDYIGVNYYSRDMVTFTPGAPGALFSRTFPKPGKPVSDFGMEIYPRGFSRVLAEVWERYKRPIYITENGVADASDQFRPAALVSHLAEMGRAQRDGVDIRGYMHWSSMDNFEWTEGYKMRFGLIEVNFTTQERRPRASAALYSDVIRQNGLDWRQLERYYPAGMPYFVGRAAGASA